MVYHSLFDRIAEADPAFRKGFEQQKYQGTLDAVLDETGEALISNGGESETILLALHPPRIIRAFVDYKVQNPDAPEVEYLLRDAIQLGLDIYRGEEGATQELGELRRRTIETGNAALLARELKQPSDLVTWDATNPAKSRVTVENLVMGARGEPVLFVALAHGGVAAGMDTYLRYCDATGADNSVFYVARCSTQKLMDITPQLSPTEIDYLQEQLKGRKAVLFDEDRATGQTLHRAQRFFTGSVFPQAEVIVLTNLDVRAELVRAEFKKQLLEIDGLGLLDSEKHEQITDLYEKHYEDKGFNKESKLKNEISFISSYDTYPKQGEGESGLFSEKLEEPVSLAGLPVFHMKREKRVLYSF